MASPFESNAPGLFRLPPELRTPILRSALLTGQEQWTPHYVDPAWGNRPVWGYPLHRCKASVQEGFRVQKRNDHTSVPGLLFSCRFLHEECLALLLHDARFLVRINVTDEAPTGANDFAHIQSLRPSFRAGIRSMALHVMIPRLRPDARGLGPVGSLRFMLDPEHNPLLFEKVVENVNELLYLMPGLENIHWMWDVWIGHSGISWIEESCARGVWRRIEKDWPGREINWTGQHGFDCYDAERFFDMGPLVS